MRYVPFIVKRTAPVANIKPIELLADTLPDLFKDQAVKDAFEERAAIIQFDGGMTREAAEKAAYAEIISSLVR